LKSNETVDYILVSPEEADFEKNKISVTSPLGKGLLGKTDGETVKIPVPAGTLEYKIIKITR
jgi:transcription elongation factor GreA